MFLLQERDFRPSKGSGGAGQGEGCRPPWDHGASGLRWGEMPRNHPEPVPPVLKCLTESCTGRMWDLRGKGSHLFDNFSSSVYGAVIDHIHDGHSQVTSDPEGNAESQSTHDGNDIPPGQPEAGTVAQRGFLFGHFHGLSIFSQLDGVPGLLPLL